MNSKSRPQDAEALKLRHFLLQTKASSDLRRRPGTPSAMSDTAVRDLLESIWIAERARSEPAADIRAIALAYSPSKWAGSQISADAMEEALARATRFYEMLDVRAQTLLI